MRTLKYREPHRIIKTDIAQAFIEPGSDKHYFERQLLVSTQFGYVSVYDINWLTNTGVLSWCQFETIIDGYKYVAHLEESKLRDRQIKWLATHFIKTILKKLEPELPKFDNSNDDSSWPF